MLSESDDETEEDKENSSHISSGVDIHNGKLLGADKNSISVFMSPDRGINNGNAKAAVDGEVEVWRHNKWLDSLIVISLELHEIITFVLLDVSSSEGAIAVSELKCLLTSLSKKHNSLHEIVVRPPWWSGDCCAPSITPAHDKLFSLHLKADKPVCQPHSCLPKEQIIRNLLQCSDASPQRIHHHASSSIGVDTVTDGIAYNVAATTSVAAAVKGRSVFSLGEEFDLKLGHSSSGSSSSSRSYMLSSAALEECDDAVRTSMDGSDGIGAKSRSVRFSLEKGYTLPQTFPTSIPLRGGGGVGGASVIEDAARLSSSECDISMDSLNSTTDLNVSSDSEAGLDHETTFEEEDSLFVVLDESK
jgi:hypothetical protein